MVLRGFKLAMVSSICSSERIGGRVRWSMDEIEERKGYHVNGPRPFLFLDERGLPLKIWYNFLEM